MDNPSQILEATESFVCEIDGDRYVVQAGLTRVAAAHQLVKSHPDRFQPIEDHLSYPTEGETASAAPGERRARPSRQTRVGSTSTEE